MLESEFLALELSHLTAEVRSSSDRMDALLSDEFLEFGRSGRTWSKAGAIAMLAQDPGLPGGDCTGADLVEFRAVLVVPGVVLVTYRLRDSLRSSLWRREGERWRVLFHQGTPSESRAMPAA